MKKAFTLAETLITLIIIGIIAALTLPILSQKYTDKVVENKLKKFYFAVNQAIDLSEIQYGDRKLWYDSTSVNIYNYDDDGNFISVTIDADAKTKLETWCNKYLIPYLKVTKTEYYNDANFTIYLADGSVFMATAHTSKEWLFFPGDINKCSEKYSFEKYGNFNRAFGKCAFVFRFQPALNNADEIYHYNKGMEPYKYHWDGTEDNLLTDGNYGCNSSNTNAAYCTALIQMNGWKIPDDYPFKVLY